MIHFLLLISFRTSPDKKGLEYCPDEFTHMVTLMHMPVSAILIICQTNKQSRFVALTFSVYNAILKENS